MQRVFDALYERPSTVASSETLWRDIEGVTHIVFGWDRYSFFAVTWCQRIQYRNRFDTLKAVLGFPPKYATCLTCIERASHDLYGVGKKLRARPVRAPTR